MSGDSLGIGDATPSSGPREGGRPPLSKKVFISYASQDAAVANAVVEALEGQGIRCWIAPRDVTPGEFYAGVIVHAIDDAKVTVLLLSRHAAASPHVVREVERAASKRHPVISLRIDREPLPADLEYFLNTSQWLDASEGEPSRVFSRLVEAVRKVLEAASATTVSGSAGSPVRPLDEARTAKWPFSRSLAVVVGLIVVAIMGFAIDKWWFSRHMAQEKPVPAALVGPTIPEKSVAVLPFVDMSEKKDQEYFSDGLSEELIDMLTKVPDLRVPARTSSFYFKGKQATITDVAKALGVSHVLEGSVRKSGSNLRITAQLIRVDNGYHLWSETYDRRLDDIFKIQDEIAGAVVKALKASLLGEPEHAGTKSVDAYNLYLQASSIYLRANVQTDYENVVEYLHEALKADPQFSNAWALLSTAVSLQGEYDYVPAKQAFEEARRAAKEALEFNPRLPDAHTAMARVLITIDWDIVAGELQLQRALQLDGSNSWALDWAGYLAAWRGRFDEAIDLVQRSIAADPVNSWRYGDLSKILYYAQKYPEVLVANRRMLDLNPGSLDGHYLVGMVLLATGNPAGALAEIESDARLRAVCGCLVSALDALGRKDEADAALRELVKNHANDNANGIGLVYARRGKFEEALGWFERAYSQHEQDLFWLKVDPLLKNEQSNPRFTALLRKMHLVDP